MRRSASKSRSIAAAIGSAILLLCLAGPAYCEQDGTALLLELSPASGGNVNLEPGVHVFDRDAEVTLIAVPNPGYRFVYWLGNVIDATASTTTVCLDTPKIIIAVFERSKLALVEFEEGPQSSLGRGGLIRSGGDYAAGLEQATGGKRPPHWHPPQPPEEQEDFPVPEGEPDFPVSVPEPATIVFIFIGMLSLAKCKRRRVEVGEVHRQTL
ncbi:MAG: PEP-CTERM sorting domain-containing protein [Sedimentisphaerales bacterium]|nr:PEP-CTERM sorting domain-containing protein [Sedimentisphaerales bacterium]